MSKLFSPISRHSALLAAGFCAYAAVVHGSGMAGFSQAQHPLALLGASGVPDALGFNWLAFIVPGLLMAWQAWCLRVAMPDDGQRPTGWSARIGAQLLQLAALAFAAQGLLPLDLADMENSTSARHAAAWMIWWLTFAIGGLALAAGMRGRLGWRRFSRLTFVVAVLLPACAVLLPQVMPAGTAQRIGLVLWFGWGLACGRVLSRSAASSPGSSPTGSA